MKRALLFLYAVIASQVAMAGKPVIETAHGSPNELATQAELEKLLGPKLDRWTFTHRILIDESAIPHSHPVLTLHTRHLGHDDELLSAYLHEQLHWFLDAHKTEAAAAVEKLRKLYPNVPVGYPDGAENEESTYEHLIVCYDEQQADIQLMGNARARSVIETSSRDHYRWIYKQVLQNKNPIGKIVAAQRLDPAY